MLGAQAERAVQLGTRDVDAEAKRHGGDVIAGGGGAALQVERELGLPPCHTDVDEGPGNPAPCRASNRPTHSAAHLDSRCGRRMSPWTLWNTRGIAHGRFRLADARIHRPGLTAAATSAAPLR